MNNDGASNKLEAPTEEMGAKQISDFLTHLAVSQKVSGSTQNQALNALVFLYRETLQREPGIFENVVRAKTPERVPVVFSRAEVASILANLHGTNRLIVALLYGTGMRLKECLRLRVKDIDFEQNYIVIKETKSNKDRIAMLPKALKDELNRHLIETHRRHRQDLQEGFGNVYSRREKKFPDMW
ncbi:tyrosine-type recombinase/integrase [Oligoflexia bacterium]|nr:tyrosine-type recombinase/integrase [Oligoflexia bacterium]